MKNQLVKSAWFMAAVVGAFTFSSCDKENEVVAPNAGKDVEVTIGVQMAGRPGGPALKAATSGDDLNMGESYQTIQNITIVPFTGTQAGTNIVYGSYTPGTDANKYASATIDQQTDMFRVYGNVPGLTAGSVFSMPDLSLQAASGVPGSLTNVYNAHPLYYFCEAKAAASADPTPTEGFLVGNGTTAGDWATAAKNAPVGGVVGDNNRVAIKTPLRYAVGALAAGVQDNVTGDNATKEIFFNGETVDGSTEFKSWTEVKEALGEGNAIIITGMIIEGQSQNFDATFQPAGADVRVYAEATGTALLDADLSSNGGKVTGANIYSVVAPEADAQIGVHFQFQNNTGYSFILNDDDADNTNNTVVKDGDYFYMYTTLDKQPDKNIFSAFTSTILNASVTDWGRATTTPIETTDVEIGITVNMDWAEGIVYDVEL